MNCDEAKSEIETDFLRKTNGQYSLDLRRHLLSCRKCRDHGGLLSRVLQSAQLEPVIEAPGELLKKMVGKLHGLPVDDGRGRTRIAYFALGFVTALVAVFLTYRATRPGPAAPSANAAGTPDATAVAKRLPDSVASAAQEPEESETPAAKISDKISSLFDGAGTKSRFESANFGDKTASAKKNVVPVPAKFPEAPARAPLKPGFLAELDRLETAVQSPVPADAAANRTAASGPPQEAPNDVMETSRTAAASVADDARETTEPDALEENPDCDFVADVRKFFAANFPPELKHLASNGNDFTPVKKTSPGAFDDESGTRRTPRFAFAPASKTSGFDAPTGLISLATAYALLATPSRLGGPVASLGFGASASAGFVGGAPSLGGMESVGFGNEGTLSGIWGNPGLAASGGTAPRPGDAPSGTSATPASRSDDAASAEAMRAVADLFEAQEETRAREDGGANSCEIPPEIR